MKSILKKIIQPALIPFFLVIFSCQKNDLFNEIADAVEDSRVYFVIYDLNGGTGAPPDDQTMYHKGEEVKLLPPSQGNFYRDEYFFVGWTEKPVPDSETEILGTESTLVMGESDITLYAQWIESFPFVLPFDGVIPGDQAGKRINGRFNSTSENFNFIYANDGTHIVFPFGDKDDNSKEITNSFFMSETVVTNRVFREVFQWAYNNGRLRNDAFLSTISVNSTNAIYGGETLIDFSYSEIHFSDGRFTIGSGYEDHPVTGVTLHGAIMFCNWLTEMIDDKDNIVYTGITEDTWSGFTINITKTGYRLPTDIEWEYAARYLEGEPLSTEGNIGNDYISRGHRDNNIPPLLSLTPGYYWTPGNYLSGALTFYNDTSSYLSSPGTSGPYPVGKIFNDRVAVYGYYWDGTWLPTTVTSLLGRAFYENSPSIIMDREPNELGLYDMSGNVWEWCIDMDIANLSDKGILRGGSYKERADKLQVGFRDPSKNSEYKEDDLGFRLAKTQ